MNLPPYAVALGGFLRRHGPRCQGRKAETFQTDLRLPSDPSQEGTVTFRCSCGWETASPINYSGARVIVVLALFKNHPLRINTIDAGAPQ